MARGWTHDPARHALAARGLKTTLQPPRITRSQLAERIRLEKRYGMSDEDLSFLYFQVEEAAYEEGGDRAGATALIQDPKWVESMADDVSRRYGKNLEEARRIKAYLVEICGIKK